MGLTLGIVAHSKLTRQKRDQRIGKGIPEHQKFPLPCFIFRDDPAVFHTFHIIAVHIVLGKTIVEVFLRLTVEAIEHSVQITVFVFHRFRSHLGIVLMGQLQGIHNPIIGKACTLIVPVGVLLQI